MLLLVFPVSQDQPALLILPAFDAEQERMRATITVLPQRGLLHQVVNVSSATGLTAAQIANLTRIASLLPGAPAELALGATFSRPGLVSDPRLWVCFVPVPNAYSPSAGAVYATFSYVVADMHQSKPPPFPPLFTIVRPSPLRNRCFQSPTFCRAA